MAKATLTQKLHNRFGELNEAGDVSGIDKLLKENNIDINATLFKIEEDKKDEGGYYLFLEILKGKNIPEKIDYFVASGADISVTNDYKNAIQRLYLNKWDLPVLEKLLEVGVDPNQADNDGTTALCKHVRTYTDTLVENYDDPDAKVWYRPKPAEEYELQLKFIQLLLKYGADPKKKNNYGTSAEDWLLHRKETGEWNEHHDALSKLL